MAHMITLARKKERGKWGDTLTWLFFGHSFVVQLNHLPQPVRHLIGVLFDRLLQIERPFVQVSSVITYRSIVLVQCWRLSKLSPSIE